VKTDDKKTNRIPEADRTVIGIPPGVTDVDGGLQPLRVTWRVGGQKQTAELTGPATIGRDASCDVSIHNDLVSRHHVKLYPDAGQWLIIDLDSGNGTFLDSVRIQQAILPRLSTLRLGSDGPRLWIEVAGAQADASEEEIAAHYFGDDADHDVGHRTMMVRRAYRRVSKEQKRRYRGIVGGAVGLLLLSVGIGIYQYLMLQKSLQIATDIFYNMKSLQVQVSSLDDFVRESGDMARLTEVNVRREELRAMETQYDQLLHELGVLGPGLSEEDRIILRVARMFGECEVNMPPGFVREVKNYIEKWKTTGRLHEALQRMHQYNLASIIRAAMLSNDLPPQFLYLALQESGFNARAVGPQTRFGIAKGIWQFIPATARHYGLRTGPLVELRRHDPKDDRFDVHRATDAAARYLRDIYYNEAQASGLLVIASYNWGPANIRKRISEMPDNPRDRNFWRLLEQHDIPQETYDYVFYIVSAIVIGEDPALFGFDFENPLEDGLIGV
jgi:membrane-bound lytic murein transglycosylase D